MKILTWDSETAPNYGAVWGKWEQNVLWWEKYGFILCIGYKWWGERHGNVLALTDYPNYKVGKENDKQLLIDFSKLVQEADIFVYQNGDRFDLPTINARLAYHRLPPLQPRQTIDTLKIFRKHFKFPANNLDEVCAYLKIGRKIRTDKNLWHDCLNPTIPEADRKRAWKHMTTYCLHDVELTEEVCTVVLPFAGIIPNSNVYNHTLIRCVNPVCGGTKLTKRGTRRTATGEIQTYQCVSCGKYSQTKREPIYSKEGQSKMLRP